MRCKKKRQRNASRDELTMCVYILCEIATVKYIAKFWNENNKRRLKIALFAHCVWRRNVGAMLVCREFIISYITRSRTEQRKKSRQSETASNKNYAFSHFDVLCHFSSSSSTFFFHSFDSTKLIAKNAHGNWFYSLQKNVNTRKMAIKWSAAV